ncbi:MAG: SH3 domain-containing protein, partial [Ardenticatenia bacterium]|nr:SH3 domain-containing protein [Ardenticatenia bacterium]
MKRTGLVAALFVIGSIQVAGCSRLESIAPLLAGGLAAPEGQTEITPLVTAEGVEVAILVVGADGLSLAMHPSQATATARALALPPTPTPVSPVTMPLVKVTASSLNVRAGPGVEHHAVGVVHSGQQLAVLGTSPDGTWLHVARGVEVDGWVSAHYVVPVAHPLPADTPLPTPSPREEIATPPVPGPMPTWTAAPSHTPTPAPPPTPAPAPPPDTPPPPPPHTAPPPPPPPP